MEMPDSVLVQSPGQIQGEFNLPASKSMFNRAMIMAALSGNAISLNTPPNAEDCQIIESYLIASGYSVNRKEGIIQVTGAPIAGKSINTDLKMAGTALRFLTGLATILPIHSIFTGSTRLGERPFSSLANALMEAGASIQFSDANFVFPITIAGNPEWQPKEIYLRNSKSSQKLSALLLLGSHFSLGTRIYFDTHFPISQPYVSLTIQMLNRIGIHWEQEADCYILNKKNLSKQSIAVEPDWSGASYALGMVLLKGGMITLPYLPPESLQGDARQLEYFHLLGMKSGWVNGQLTVSASGESFQGFDFDFSGMPDLAQTFAVIAAFATSPSILSGLHSLRLKETNRIDALRYELTKLGAQVSESDGVMQITPGTPLSNPIISTYNDHRMAMAFSLAACRLAAIQIENPGVVGKSFPEYWSNLKGLGFKFETEGHLS